MTFFRDAHVEARLKQIEAAQKLSSSGGVNRAKALPSKKRSEIASKASKARWNKNLQANAC